MNITNKTSITKEKKALKEANLDIKIVKNGKSWGHDGEANTYLVYFGFENTNEAILFSLKEDGWSYDLVRDSVTYVIDKLNDLTPSNIKRKFQACEKNPNIKWDNNLYDKMNDIINNKKIKAYYSSPILSDYIGLDEITYLIAK